MKHLKIILKWALPSIKAGYNLLAVSAEVFCRHSFGPRYAQSLLASFFFCFVSMACLRAVFPDESSPIIDIYLLSYFILVLYHLGRMWRPPTTTHSYSNGQSWGFWERLNVIPAFVKIVFEPAVHVLVGMAIHSVNVLLSDWLLSAGLCLCIKEFLSFWRHWNRVLDSADARIEGERISSGVRRYTSPQSGGEQRVSPAVAVEQPQQPTSSIGQIFSRLDPALQQLMSSPNQNHPDSINARAADQQVPRRYHAGPLGTLPRITTSRRKNR
jgi:hypothetical protein